MFTAANLIIAKIWKLPKCQSLDELIKKMWSTYTVEFYSAMKREILPFLITWMDLEEFMIGELSQTEEDKYRIVSIIGKTQGKVKLIKTENRKVFARCWEIGEIGRHW